MVDSPYSLHISRCGGRDPTKLTNFISLILMHNSVADVTGDNAFDGLVKGCYTKKPSLFHACFYSHWGKPYNYRLLSWPMDLHFIC